MESPHFIARNFELTRESFLTKDGFFPKHLIMPKDGLFNIVFLLKKFHLGKVGIFGYFLFRWKCFYESLLNNLVVCEGNPLQFIIHIAHIKDVYLC